MVVAKNYDDECIVVLTCVQQRRDTLLCSALMCEETHAHHRLKCNEVDP
jgi:hypothetical protein